MGDALAIEEFSVIEHVYRSHANGVRERIPDTPANLNKGLPRIETEPQDANRIVALAWRKGDHHLPALSKR